MTKMGQKSAKLHQDSKLFDFFFKNTPKFGEKKNIVRDKHHGNYQKKDEVQKFNVGFCFIEQLVQFMSKKTQCRANDFPSIIKIWEENKPWWI